MTIGAPIAPMPVPTTAPAAVRPPTLEERVAELSLYAESGDAVAEGEIWHVEESAPVFGEDGLGFDDILDIINPLHHIPVVGTLYRAITGDTIASAPRVLGGTLFGGVIGFAAALVNAVVDEATGSDIGDKTLALFTGERALGGNAVAAASAAPAAAQTPAQTTAKAATPPAASSAPGIVSSRPSPSNPALAAFLADRGAGATHAMTKNGQAAQNGQIPPSEALIRARSAVPAVRKSAALGFGGATARATGYPQSAAAGPAASAPPGTGKPGHPVAKPAFPSVVSNQPARYTAAAHPSTAPISAAKATPDAAAQRTGARTGAMPPDDVGSVPTLMRQALQKYEVLMQARRSPTLEDEI